MPLRQWAQVQEVLLNVVCRANPECPLSGQESGLIEDCYGSLPGLKCLNSKRVRLRGMAQIFPASIVGAAVKQATNQMDHYELE